MSRACCAALALWVLAGCGGGTNTVAARFAGPAALVAFRGVTRAHPGVLQTYFAVASTRGDEVDFVDPQTEQPVPGPGAVFPLVVPTAPRPGYLAATSLQDGGADLLVSAGVGSTLVQLISTWDTTTRIAGDPSQANPGVDLSADVAPGSAILGMVAIPALGPDATGITTVQPGKAWAVVALTGGQLAVVEFQRVPGALSIARSARPVWVQHLGFDAVQMTALLAEDATWRIFCATPDALTASSGATVHGVAEVVAGPPGATWRVLALDAHAPTRLVAAAYVSERLPGAPDTFDGAPRLRAYAILDESGCGPDQAIACGLVTLDEGTGALAADPAASAVPSANPVPAQPFRAPMEIPSQALGISIALPPSTQGGNPAQLDMSQGFPLLLTAPASGQRYTSAFAAVPASDGKVYFADLGRWALEDDVSLLNDDSSRVRASAVTPSLPPAATGTEYQYLGIASPTGSSATYSIDGTVTPGWVEVTPGFTRAEQWQLVWQGVLPSLSYRSGVLFALADGTPALALQQQLGSGWRVMAALADPALGVNDDLPNGRHDTAVLTAAAGQDLSRCPLDATGNAVLVVSAVLAPDPVNYPGGAVALSDLRSDGTHCLPALPRFDATAQVAGSLVSATIRAGGLVLSGTVSGYAGRPQAGQRYALAWSPADYDATPSSARALARKARRYYYSSDARCPGQGYCPSYPWWTDPLAPGPAIAFRAGFLGTGTLYQDTSLVITTQSGVSPASRRPTTAGALPRTGVAFDRGLVGRADQGIRFYVPYSDDQVLAFSPGESAGDIVVIK